VCLCFLPLVARRATGLPKIKICILRWHVAWYLPKMDGCICMRSGKASALKSCALVWSGCTPHINSDFRSLSKSPSYAITPESSYSKTRKLLFMEIKSPARFRHVACPAASFGSHPKFVFPALKDRGYVCSVPTSWFQTFRKTITFAAWIPKCLLEQEMWCICASPLSLHIKSIFRGLQNSPSSTTTQLHLPKNITNSMIWRSKLCHSTPMWRFRLPLFSPRLKPTSQGYESCKYAPAVQMLWISIAQKMTSCFYGN